jgi:hypothetical protein
MGPDLRQLAWNAVERVFTDRRLEVGSQFPIAIMVAVREEHAIANVRGELTRAGLEVASVDKKRWPFGRRWEIAAKSRPLPIARAEVDSWLDNLEAKLAMYDADVLTWVPLLPGA